MNGYSVQYGQTTHFSKIYLITYFDIQYSLFGVRY